MHIQQMISRSALCLLGLLGLTLFASPVAAQVFDSRPSDPGLSRLSMSRLLYTFNGGQLSVQAVSAHVQSGAIDGDVVDDTYVVYPSAQSITGRQLNDDQFAILKGLHPTVKSLVGARCDLFYTTEGPVGPGLLENWTAPFGGPYWDFMPAGTTPIASPPLSALGKGRDARTVAEIETLINNAGYTLIHNDTQPHGFSLPYEPRVNHVTKEIWFNQQQADLRSPEWRESITDYLASFELHTNAEGVFFQFQKPQHYGNHTLTTLKQHLDAGTLAGVTRTFVRYDNPQETPYEWFKSYELMYWLMMEKKRGIMVLDLSYFGLPVWNYVRQIANEWATVEGITVPEAVAAFYRDVKSMGRAADRVVMGPTTRETTTEYTLPGFGVPADFTEGLNLIEVIAAEEPASDSQRR